MNILILIRREMSGPNILTGTFDTTYALSSLYLWLLFSYLSSLINCDLQKALQSSLIVKHVTGLVAFFFLFTILDGNSKKAGLLSTWIKTIFVYVIFVLSIKSKWYFAVPVLVLLLVDQSVKVHLAWLENKASGTAVDFANRTDQEAAAAAAEGFKDDDDKKDKNANKDKNDIDWTQKAKDFSKVVDKMSLAVNIIIIVMAVIGFVHYGFLQYAEYGPQYFSFVQLLFGSGCGGLAVRLGGIGLSDQQK